MNSEIAMVVVLVDRLKLRLLLLGRPRPSAQPHEDTIECSVR